MTLNSTVWHSKIHFLLLFKTKIKNVFHSVAQTIVAFQPTDLRFQRISVTSKTVGKLLNESIAVFHDVIRRRGYSPAFPTPKDDAELEPRKRPQVNVQVAIVSDEVQLQTTTDESYSMLINTQFPSPTGPTTPTSVTSVFITASTFFGARHALETLSQLMAWDDSIDRIIMVTDATISDSPAFPHRGLLIDTSRNFVTVEMIKKIIDAMSYNKLNVFHWHITDTHSFPFVSRREPLLALYGAYSASQIYRPQDIEDLVHYATVRGVKIVPEFDAPAHVGTGWEWGPKYGLGDLALCVNKEPWTRYCVEPPCGQLNPINDNIYPILHNIYKDVSYQLFYK